MQPTQKIIRNGTEKGGIKHYKSIKNQGAENLETSLRGEKPRARLGEPQAQLTLKECSALQEN